MVAISYEPCATPTVRREGDRIVITCETDDAHFFYTVDGTDPEPSSEDDAATKPYTDSDRPLLPYVPFDQTVLVIKAVATKLGYAKSHVGSTGELQLECCATPTVTFSTSDGHIGIKCDTPHTNLLWCKDDNPTMEHYEVTHARVTHATFVAKDLVVVAVAQRHGFRCSDVARVIFAAKPCQSPQIEENVISGEVTITCPSPDNDAHLFWAHGMGPILYTDSTRTTLQGANVSDPTGRWSGSDLPQTAECLPGSHSTLAYPSDPNNPPDALHATPDGARVDRRLGFSKDEVTTIKALATKLYHLPSSVAYSSRLLEQCKPPEIRQRSSNGVRDGFLEFKCGTPGVTFNYVISCKTHRCDLNLLCKDNFHACKKTGPCQQRHLPLGVHGTVLSVSNSADTWTPSNSAIFLSPLMVPGKTFVSVYTSKMEFVNSHAVALEHIR